MGIIIVAPSLDPAVNVSGVSAVANFIIQNNPSRHYLHFLQGKGDTESGNLLRRACRLTRTYIKWRRFLHDHPNYFLHYNFPLDAPSILRDYWFMALAVRERREMVIHIHGGLYLFEKKRPWLINHLLKRIFHWASPVIVQSEKEKKALEDDFKASHVHVLPNCIDISQAKTFRRDNYEAKPLEIVYLGRIEPNKGMDDMLAATETLRDRGVDFVLHLAGKEQSGTAYLPRFEKALGRRFKYEGVVAGKEKDELLRRCHLFLLPSLYEGLPMSLLECMSYGMVPVTTDVGSINTVVEDGKNGFFVKQKDPKGIADIICALDNDRTRMREMSSRAQQTILSKFSPEHYITTLNQIYSAATS